MESYDEVGILGVGNMGSALLEGLGEASGFSTRVFDLDETLLARRVEEYDVIGAESVRDLFESTDFVVLCVKPKDVPSALNEAGDRTVNLVSIAAGVTIGSLESHLGSDSAVVRVMPNTPAQVGEGMSFLSPGADVSESFLEAARAVFDTVGETEVVKEDALDAVTALSGSGPAYVFYFLEALQEAGVYMGLDEDQSRNAALQTVLGSAKLARESDEDPSALRRAVSSPGGTTVEALQSLDEDAVKGKLKDAVFEAFRKSQSMGNGE